eukprot:TRINITY_DN14009_c0_g1_i1.p1 TRINITY_DN14009_c0_g1~~TRINITY_DN14009_c0_g1_i1.p1  ORF type:complete len:592 (+),score=160.17 TRINITY_DN14009_c0_g1_i1:26-1801(+)
MSLLGYLIWFFATVIFVSWSVFGPIEDADAEYTQPPVKVHVITSHKPRANATTEKKVSRGGVCRHPQQHEASADIDEPLERISSCEWKLLRPEGGVIQPGFSVASYSPQNMTSCPFEFRRAVTSRGSDLDVFTHASATPFLRHAPKITWCAGHKEWRSCRYCGYSCNNFPRLTRLDQSVGYPHGSTIKLFIDRHRYLTNTSDVWMAEMKEKYPVGRRLLATKYKTMPTPWLRLYGDGQEAHNSVLTAERMGFRVVWRPDSEFNKPETKGRCKATSNTLTFFFGRRLQVKLVQSNIGHWIHDNYFPIFSVINKYVPLRTAEDATKYRVVAMDDKALSRFNEQWAVGPLAHLLEAIMPKRRSIYAVYKSCITRAVFDCAEENSMEPMEPLWNWLQNVHKMSFTPLGKVQRRNMLLMLRRPGTSRSIANPGEMASTADSLGWNVSLPLDPTTENGTIWMKMLDVLPLLQECSLLVGFHGTELAPMIFMPRGSAVVEIVPLYFRYLDAWYIHQAKASSLHLVRWTPANSSVVYGAPWNTSETFAHYNQKYEQLYYSELKEGRRWEFGARALRSSLTVPMGEWEEVLRGVAELLDG